MTEIKIKSKLYPFYFFRWLGSRDDDILGVKFYKFALIYRIRWCLIYTGAK